VSLLSSSLSSTLSSLFRGPPWGHLVVQTWSLGPPAPGGGPDVVVETTRRQRSGPDVSVGTDNTHHAWFLGPPWDHTTWCLGPPWDRWVGHSAVFGTVLGPMCGSNEVPGTALGPRNVVFGTILGQFVVPTWLLGPPWDHIPRCLGPPWDHCGATARCSGPSWDPFVLPTWFLGPPWDHTTWCLGPPWDEWVGHSAVFGTVLGPICGSDEVPGTALGPHNVVFGTILGPIGGAHVDTGTALGPHHVVFGTALGPLRGPQRGVWDRPGTNL
jgi:hypothetical protein